MPPWHYLHSTPHRSLAAQILDHVGQRGLRGELVCAAYHQAVLYFARLPNPGRTTESSRKSLLPQGISSASAMPWPPPMQSVTMPCFSPSRRIECIRRVASTAPLAPMGWP